MTRTMKSTAAIALLGAIIWWMGHDVVWLGDDLDYKYRMKGAIWQSWGWINSVEDYFRSQWQHYLHVNGRIIAHAFVQLFNGILGQEAFAVCNAIFYALFAATLAKAGDVDFKKNPGGVLSAVCLSALCFVTKMMPTCQIGYIWGMAVNLWWLSAFFRNGRPSWGFTLLLFLTGIAAGNWQEGISIGICAALGIWWLRQFFNRNKTLHPFFDWRRSWMMLGYFIGTAVNCFSPATLERASTVATPLSDQIIITACSLPALLLLAITAAYTKVKYGKINASRRSSRISPIPDSVLVTGIIFLLAFNAIVGVYSNRQLFGVNLFASILTLRILPFHRLGTAANAVAAAATLLMWAAMATGIQEVKGQYREIERLYKKSDNGQVIINRKRVTILGHPSDAKYYEDILGQFDNDLHHSLMKDFKHERKGKTLKLLPAAIPDREKVERYAPGHYNVTVRQPDKGEKPREVTVYGHYSPLRFFSIPASPRKLQILKYSRRMGSYATATIIPEYPLFTADSIRIEQ